MRPLVLLPSKSLGFYVNVPLERFPANSARVGVGNRPGFTCAFFANFPERGGSFPRVGMRHVRSSDLHLNGSFSLSSSASDSC